MGIDALIAMLVPVVLGSIGAWFWLGDDARRTRRVLRSVRVTPVAELVDGQLACVVGTVALEGTELLTTSARFEPCSARIFSSTVPRATSRYTVTGLS